MLQERVKKINEVKKAKSLMSRYETELSIPITTDVSYIGRLYSKLSQRIKRGNSAMAGRRAFLFVVLYYFSPAKLAGGKIHPSVMGELSRVMRLNKSLLSHCCDNLFFQYTIYKDFRRMVNRMNASAEALMVTFGMDEDTIKAYHEKPCEV